MNWFPPHPFRRCVWLGAVVLGASPLSGVDVDVTRSLTAGTPSGLWSDPNIWVPNQVPNNIPAAPPTTYHASLSSGAPLTIIDGVYTVNRLDVTAASLTAAPARFAVSPARVPRSRAPCSTRPAVSRPSCSARSGSSSPPVGAVSVT